MIIAYVDAYRKEFGVEPICRVLKANDIQIAPSTYYAARSRPPSPRSVRDERLVEVIKEVHAANYSCYGVLKMQRALFDEGESVGRDQTARLMRQAGVRGKVRGKKVITTKRQAGATRYPDLVAREWDKGAPDRVWIADLTYVRTSEGMAYVSLLQDAGSRNILGFTISRNQHASLVSRSVLQAVSVRRRQDPSFESEGVIHHSDAGSQFTSLAFGRELTALGIAGSIGRVGTAHDNAMMESTIGLYKTELVHDRWWVSIAELEAATTAWVAWFNNQRLHSALGYLSPARFEAEYYEQRDSLKRAA